MHYETITTEWQDFPEGTRADGQIFAIGDVHGRADLLERMLGQIDGLPAPETPMTRNLVFLGDLIDRGPESLRAIRLSMMATLGGRPAVVLPGNHEAMLLAALREPAASGAFHCWYENGGHALVDELPCGGIGNINQLREKIASALPEGFLDTLETKPTHHVSGDLLLVHAGILPPSLIAPAFERRGGKIRTLQDFLAQPLMEQSGYHWAWIRDPFMHWTQGWDPERRMVVVHGHTVTYAGAIDDADDIADAADLVHERRRINLDAGAVFYGRLVALEAIDGRYRFHAIIGSKW